MTKKKKQAILLGIGLAAGWWFFLRGKVDFNASTGGGANKENIPNSKL